MRKRHRIFWKLLRPLIKVFLWCKFGFTSKKAANLPDHYIVLSNHVTDYDPLMLAASFPRQMYFVASEHIARWKHAFKWIDFAFSPIIRYKGTVAASTVVEILRRVRKGANVAIFAEGTRTWDGVTCPILPSTAKLIKSARCGLVTYKLVGGHFVSPMWSGSNTRRGYCHGEVAGIYTKEQIAAMSQDELYEVITRDLYEDAFARQKQQPREYRGKRLAEGLENLLFICPQCGNYDSLTSSGDTLSCQCCSMSATYTTCAALTGTRFDTLKAFSDWQNKRVEQDVENGVVYHADSGTLISVSEHVETPLDSGEIALDGANLRCGNTTIAVADISDMAMHGKRALVFSTAGGYYELIPARGANARKFWLYYQACTQKETVGARG